MKVIICPINTRVILRNDNNKLLETVILTEKSPKTLLYSPKDTSIRFNAMNFVCKGETIVVNGVSIYTEYAEINLGKDEYIGTFGFINTNEIRRN